MTIPSISGGGPNDTRQSQIVWEWVRTFYEPNLFAKIEFTEGLKIESICLHFYVITFSSPPILQIFLLPERLETCKFSEMMWRFFSENGSAKRDWVRSFPGPHCPTLHLSPSRAKYMSNTARNDLLQGLPGPILIPNVRDSPKRSPSIGFEGFLVLMGLPCA